MVGHLSREPPADTGACDGAASAFVRMLLDGGGFVGFEID